VGLILGAGTVREAELLWWIWHGELIFLLGLLATAAFGLWMGLRNERYSQAVSKTAAYLMLGAVVICFFTLPERTLAWGSVMGWFGLCFVLGCWRVFRFMKASRDGANLTGIESV